MILSTIIHGLEVTVVLLSALLAYQIVRCNRAFYQNPQSAIEPSSADFANLETVIEVSEELELVAEENIEPALKSQSQSILDDYIGEFFSEEPQANIQAFKAKDVDAESISGRENSSAAPEVTADVLAAYKNAPEKTVEQAANDVPEFSPELSVSEPVLLNQVQLIATEEEDSFIVVESEEYAVDSHKVDVMSDKVVHAMLKEAKLAVPN